MKWTRLIPFAAFAVAAPAALAAQDTIKPAPPPTEQNHPMPQMNQAPTQDSTQLTWYQQRMNTLLKGITLAPEQKTKVDSIQLKFKDQLPPMPNQTRQNDPNNPHPSAQPDSAQQSMLLMVLERQDTEVRAALKPDQQKIWDKNKQEWKKNRTPIG
jgi:hypothetical protein